MAKGALAAGFASQGQAGGRRGSGGTPGFADIAFRAGDIAERKKIREQEAQDEFTKARKEFEQEQSDLYGAIAYEDQFDETGITDIDEAGNKLASVLKSEYEMTQQLYRMGKIDENEVRRRNARMKGQVGQLKSGVYDKITKFKADLDAKIQAGTDSEADRMKLRHLEKMTENVSFGVDSMGNIELRIPGETEDESQATSVPTGIDSQVVDGKIQIGDTKTKTVSNKGTGAVGVPTRITMSQFSQNILQNENGADLNAMTERIRGLEKSGDIYRAGSREYTRYTQPDGEGGRKLSPDQDELMSIAIAELSPTEKLDALKKLGGDFKQMGITDNDVLGYDNDPEKVKAIDDALKQGLNNKLMNELRAMESSKPYDDPLERAKELGKIRSSNEKPLVRTMPILGKDARDGRGDRIQIAPTDLRGLGASGLTENDRFKKAAFAEAQKYLQTLGPMYSDPTFENAKVVGANNFIDEGVLEVEFEFDVKVPDPDRDGKFIVEKRQTKINYSDIEDKNKFMTGFNLKGYSSDDWYEERARKKEGKVKPNSFLKYND